MTKKLHMVQVGFRIPTFTGKSCTIMRGGRPFRLQHILEDPYILILIMIVLLQENFKSIFCNLCFLNHLSPSIGKPVASAIDYSMTGNYMVLILAVLPLKK